MNMNYGSMGPGAMVRCRQCSSSITAMPGARAVQCMQCSCVTRVSGRGRQQHGYGQGYGGNGGGMLMPPMRPTPAFGGGRGKKRAVLIGIKYTNRRSCELRGPINDVKCMRYLLTERFGFPNDCEEPVQAADQGQHPHGDALAGAGVQLRRLPGVPVLWPGRAGARRRRRRAGRHGRGPLPRGLVPAGPHPGRRDQRGHRPPAGARRQAPRHRRRLPQRHRPRPPLPMHRVQVEGRAPYDRRLQGHQRRPGRAHQRQQQRKEQHERSPTPRSAP
ncbi:unnamed protein product [Triticum turgidum subsp. durum]|uniref:Uncharacterized protein n=1 Tax=Triticum turgidum subsp. durum TaxID=4567 RepID=A0A9R0RX75_TRITD|nr:unnamed protein product [Triticum turgidum subsp. durum]